MTPTTRTAIGAAAVVFATAGAVMLTSVASPTPDPIDTSPQTVPSSAAQLSCPQPSLGRGLSTSVLAVAPPSGEGDAAAGALVVHPLSPDRGVQRRSVGTSKEVGVPVATSLDADARPAVTVDAEGGLAPGAFAAQQTAARNRTEVGLAVARCEPTADDWWFTGADTSVGSTSRIVLSNPTLAVAVVDLRFYGPRGVVSAVGARGIPVAPQTLRSIDLARFAPGLDAVTVHVQATRGRVAAAIQIARVNGATPAGTEWLAASERPSRDLVVNAGDAGGGSQRLILTNTSGREALVDVDVLASSGPFKPKALQGLQVRPGHTVVRDVSTITDTAAVALHVTVAGDQAAVTAALISESSSPPVELSTSSTSPALSDPAVVPLFSGSRVTVAMAAMLSGGAVRIAAYDDSGQRVGEPVRLAGRPRTTVTWDGPIPPRAEYLVLSVLDGGDLHAVATYHGRAGLSAIPIVSGAWSITRPAVRPAP